MKVCTDACLFGAWTASEVRGTRYEVRTVLDIGTGTGLLSLMMAQQLDASIDAIELDKNAADQSLANFKESKWNDKLHLIQGDIRKLKIDRTYDLIISNPPFFENDLKSPDQQRNLALHSDQLKLDELLDSVNNLLNIDGQFAVLLPYHRKGSFLQLAKDKGFFPKTIVNVKQNLKHDHFRVMILLSRFEKEVEESEISIRDDQNYSMQFIELLKDYYLKL